MRGHALAIFALCALAACMPTATPPPTRAGSGAPILIDPLRTYQLEAGVAWKTACDIWLVGERVNPARLGVALHSGNCGVKVEAIELDGTDHVRAIAVSGSAVYVAGDNLDGTGFVRVSTDGVKWEHLALAAGTIGVDAIAVDGATLWIAGRRVGAASLWSMPLSGDAAPLEHATIPNGSFTALVADNDGVLGVGGTDVQGAFVHARRGEAAQVLLVDVSSDLLALSTDGTKVTVGGGSRAAGQPEFTTGFVGSSELASLALQPEQLPPGVTVALDLTAVGDARWAIVSAENGTVLAISRGRGAPWTLASGRAPDDRGIAAFIRYQRRPTNLLLGAGLFWFDLGALDGPAAPPT